ncbi:MAG: hypothetical protein GXP63_07330 [DPANN group archaeon]|nr:hypothetical protein [DPANN group archaeon]
MILILHSQEDLRLAHAETQALMPKAVSHGLWSTVKRASPTIRRLAYSRMALRILWEGRAGSFWKKGPPDFTRAMPKGSFAVRFRSLDGDSGKTGSGKLDARKVIERVAAGCRGKKVDLAHPRNTIWCITQKDRLFIGLQTWKNEERFAGRRNHLRRARAPVSLHPKLARAMVNLTGVRTSGMILDPLCGTGGILIEAGLMGIRVTGQDIDRVMVDRTKKNLAGFRIQGKVIQKDVFLSRQAVSYVVTDPPYGKNTSIRGDAAVFYARIIRKLAAITRKRIVVSFPRTYDPRPTARTCNLKLVGVFDHVLHRSLTKVIYVFEKDSRR